MQVLENERRGRTEDAELRDEAFGRTIGIGVLFGIPVMFIVLFPVFLLGTGRPGVAPAILWASLVGGGYFGGFLALLAVDRVAPDGRNHTPSGAAPTSIRGGP